MIDDFVIQFCNSIKAKDFVVKTEELSGSKKSKREYLNDKMQTEFFKNLEAYFTTKVDVPRIMVGEKQEIETLIGEEALLFAKYLRGEKPHWNPRIVKLV